MARHVHMTANVSDYLPLISKASEDHLRSRVLIRGDWIWLAWYPLRRARLSFYAGPAYVAFGIGPVYLHLGPGDPDGP